MPRVLPLIALAAVLVTACGPRPRPAAPSGHAAKPPGNEAMPPGNEAPRAGDTIRVQVAERGRLVVREVGLDAYAAAVALGEFSPAAGEVSAVERMFEVQTVVSRTYAAAHRGRHASEGFDLCATTHCQIYEPGRLDTSRWADAARRAAAATAGRLLLFDGRPADALFHADCGGRTSAAVDVWGGQGFPYLRARADLGVAAEAHRVWEYTTTLERLAAALADAGLIARGQRVTGLSVEARDEAGRATAVGFPGTAAPPARGTAVREACTRAFGARAVRSTRFSVTTSGGAVTFTGTGFGHGVGLCQVGAFARLQAGSSLDAVLTFYYPGTTLTPAPSLRRSSHRRPD